MRNGKEAVVWESKRGGQRGTSTRLFGKGKSTGGEPDKSKNTYLNLPATPESRNPKVALVQIPNRVKAHHKMSS